MRNIVFCVVLVFHLFLNGANAFKDPSLYCYDDDECDHISGAECVSDECTCLDNHIMSPNKTICLELAKELGDQCEIDQQCTRISSAICRNKTCVVAEDDNDTSLNPPTQVDDGAFQELPNGPKTLDLHNLGKPCVSDVECNLEGSFCKDRKCLCKDDLVPSQNLKLCLPKARQVGDECIESIQCLSLSGSVCMNMKCTPATDFLKGGSIGKMNPATLMLGSTCQQNDECSHLVHSVCRENVCECTEDYVTSVSSNSCLPRAKNEGDDCEVDKQCENIPGAFCAENKCIKFPPSRTSLENPNSAAAVGPWRTSRTAIAALAAAILTRGFCFP